MARKIRRSSEINISTKAVGRSTASHYFSFGEADSFNIWPGAEVISEPDNGLADDTQTRIDLGWLFEALHSTDESGVKVLGVVVDGVNDLVRSRAFRLLDQALSDINVDTASKHVLLGLARSTYPVRTKLTEWKTFVIRVDEAFRRRELDSDRLLKGLAS